MRKTTLTIAGLTVAALLATASGAQASGWITGSQIKDGTVTGRRHQENQTDRYRTGRSST